MRFLFIFAASVLSAQIPFPGPGRFAAGGGAGPTPHTQWQILVSETATTNAGMAEIDFRDASGTLVTTGCTFSASSTYTALSPDDAFDNDRATNWASDVDPNMTPQYIRMTCDDPVVVASVTIVSISTGLHAPIDFVVQHADGGSFTTAATYTAISWSAEPANRAKAFAVETPAADNYLMFEINISATQTGDPSLGELELRATVSGSNIATGGRCFATTFYDNESTYGCASAFDGSTASLWAAISGAPQELGYCLPRARQVAEIALKARDDAPANSPDTFTLKGSNDGGKTWTTLGTFDAATWTTSGQVQTFTP